MKKMKATRPKTSDGKDCSFLVLTDAAGKQYTVSLTIRGDGHRITKELKDLRSDLLEKLKASVNDRPGQRNS